MSEHSQSVHKCGRAENEEVTEIKEKRNAVSSGVLLPSQNVGGELIHHVFSKIISLLSQFSVACTHTLGMEKKNQVIDADEKRVIAFHEAGHALASWFLLTTDPISKISIIPRGQTSSLGHTQYLPEERHLHHQLALKNKLAVMLGGRAAEALYFDHVSTGAEDDLRRVTDLAYRMVTQFGMSQRVGLLTYDRTPESGRRKFSRQLMSTIDMEVGFPSCLFSFSLIVFIFAPHNVLGYRVFGLVCMSPPQFLTNVFSFCFVRLFR